MANFNAVYWVEADASTTPYIVFWLISDTGEETLLNKTDQGESRIQFDLWDDSKNRGRRLRTVLRDKVKAMNESRGGYNVNVVGLNMVTLQRTSETDLFHFVVDGIVQWYKE
jgi:hypothetical protein